MIAPGSTLSIARQAKLRGASHSSVYYRPKPEPSEELDLLKRLDELFTGNPMYGSRRLQAMLKREGVRVGRRRIRTLMKKLGLWAVGPKPNTSKPHPEHRIYPYLLRGFLYLCVILDWATRKVLSWRLSNTLTSDFCTAVLSEALTRHGRPANFNTDQGSEFIRDTRGRIMRADLIKRMRASLKLKGFSQVPQLECSAAERKKRLVA